MAKAELGEKQLCPNCGAKFYDLQKRPAHCPKCDTEFDPGDETVKLKRVKTTRSPTFTPDYEDDEAPRRPEAEDGDEEVEETPELDEAADEPAVSESGEDEDASAPDKIPEGFSEDEADLDEDEAPVDDDDDEPILDLDEDEEFGGDELGDKPDEGDDDPR